MFSRMLRRVRCSWPWLEAGIQAKYSDWARVDGAFKGQGAGIPAECWDWARVEHSSRVLGLGKGGAFQPSAGTRQRGSLGGRQLTGWARGTVTGCC